MNKQTLRGITLYALLLIGIQISLNHWQAASQATPEPTEALTASDEVWAITDSHYLSPDLHDEGVAFQKMQNTAAGKDIRYTKERMQALVYEVQQKHPKALIVSGDLTFNGEYQSAVELAQFFDQMEAAGTKVLVIPGNHDIADGWARQFQDDKNFKIKQITKKDWVQLFTRHGYDDAASRDTSSLSYLSKAFTNLWFLMIDSNIYTEQGEGKGAPATNGVVRKETLEWMHQQLQEAQDAGVTVIPVIHHNVLDHHEQVTTGFTVDNASDVRALFAQFPNVFFGLSGHIHSQHIATETLGAGHRYTEVVNGAFSIYPAVVGTFSLLDDGSIHYQRTTLETDAWAQATQQTNPDLTHHQAYLEETFDEASRTLVEQTLFEEQWYDATMAADIGNLIAPLNRAYFTGEKLDSVWLAQDFYASPAYQLLEYHQDRSFLYRYSQQIIRENQQGDNLEVTVHP